ncbi:MAG: MbtH family NRPS accessory protein [Ramlibacter sp.]|nr:MbtH family NRPS accessory protein [Ramlibacter sp.]
MRSCWMLRVFHIETGALVACDARWDGRNWQRGETFTFLYRSRRHQYFQLRAVRTWCVVTPEQARALYERLPEKVMSLQEAFEAEPEFEVLPRGRDDDEDMRDYKVVRNGDWYFSLCLEYQALPAGWRPIGFAGTKQACLDFIRRNCVFGAPNPRIP